jgi:hypothetical protein
MRDEVEDSSSSLILHPSSLLFGRILPKLFKKNGRILPVRTAQPYLVCNLQ